VQAFVARLALQRAPIHIAIETMNMLTETSDTTSCSKSAMELSRFGYVLFMFY
jgi:hypothetical protein